VLYSTRVVVDPSNHHLIPANADCRCDDAAGFDLQLSSNHEILLVRPGLDCIHC
jgi:hypothetical protein